MGNRGALLFVCERLPDARVLRGIELEVIECIVSINASSLPSWMCASTFSSLALVAAMVRCAPHAQT